MESVSERTIMWGDLDVLGIVFYPRYYEWIDAGSHLLFNRLGLNLGTLGAERGMQFGLAETSCHYHRPGRYFQQIRIVTTIDSLSDKCVHLAHRIYRSKDNVLMVDGHEKRICMDVSNPDCLRACPIPADIRKTLEAAIGERPAAGNR